uniref:Immunoglobulin domain-containing protein n=1 Tax=Cyprinus carpio TaxID=7962 RepID=A0A8C1Z155_CYPCA
MFHRFWFCLCLWCLDGVDALMSVSVVEGDSVTLESGVTEIQTDDLIAWTFGRPETLIARINKENVIFSTSDGDAVGFRGRLKLDHQTGSLTITNIRTTDSGLYNVTIKRTKTHITNRFSVTVYAHRQTSHTSGSLLIVLITAAGSLVIVPVIVLFCICRKHRDAVHEDETPAAALLYKHTELMMESDVTEVIYTCFITEH